MTDNGKLFESLLEKATDYGKTSLELIKLKVIDKSSDAVSSIIPHTVVVIIISSFLIFINLGIAFWLGEILGKICYGFFIVAGFYGLAGFIIHVFMHKWLKNIIYNYLIKLALK